jgi:thiol-disulfide isomerase/thioredoxin
MPLSTGIARWVWRLVAALAVALGCGPVAAQGTPDLPPRAILLFVANWCAPCHAEIARLDEIVVAARPFRVLVVSLDDDRGAARMLRGIDPDRRWRPDRTTLARVRGTLFADVSGLPYSVAVDADGRPCGDSRRGLDADRARALVRACFAPRD